MDVQDTQVFLQRLGCDRISVGTKWVRSTCPLQFRHRGGRDRNPSFAISIDPGDTSSCRCQACGYFGDLMPLSWKLGKPGVMEYLSAHNQISPDRPDHEKPVDPNDLRGRVSHARTYVPAHERASNFVHPDDEPQAEVPEEILQQMIEDLSGDVLDYLMRVPDRVRGIDGRNLSRLTISEWELGWHPIKGRICVPIRDVDGKLVSVSGRLYPEDRRGPKYLHTPFKRNRILYGSHRLDRSIRKGYLCEGFFQVIFLDQCGYKNALARMGTHLSRQQADMLVEWFDHLVIVPDGDKAGYDSAKVIRATLDTRIPRIDIADMPRGKDADTLFADQLREVLN